MLKAESKAFPDWGTFLFIYLFIFNFASRAGVKATPAVHHVFEKVSEAVLRRGVAEADEVSSTLLSIFPRVVYQLGNCFNFFIGVSKRSVNARAAFG